MSFLTFKNVLALLVPPPCAFKSIRLGTPFRSVRHKIGVQGEEEPCITSAALPSTFPTAQLHLGLTEHKSLHFFKEMTDQDQNGDLKIHPESQEHCSVDVRQASPFELVILKSFCSYGIERQNNL